MRERNLAKTTDIVEKIESYLNDMPMEKTFKDFEELDRFIEHMVAGLGDVSPGSLAALEQHMETVPAENQTMWYHSLSVLRQTAARVAEVQAAESEEDETETEPVEEEDDDEDGNLQLEKTGWLAVWLEMSALSDYFERLRKIKIIGHIFRINDLVSRFKVCMKWVFKKIIQFIRFVTFADALDSMSLWVKKNYSHLKIIVLIATLIELFIAFVMFMMFIISVIVRPDKVVRKFIPDEIEDAIPTDGL